MKTAFAVIFNFFKREMFPLQKRADPNGDTHERLSRIKGLTHKRKNRNLSEQKPTSSHSIKSAAGIKRIPWYFVFKLLDIQLCFLAPLKGRMRA